MPSKIEELLETLLNGETIDFEPRSRIEAYLKNCCEGCGCDGLPEPKSRVDALLYALAEKLAGGGAGGDEEIIVKLNDFSYFFYNNARLDLLDSIDTSECTNFESMFQTDSLTTSQIIEVPKFNTSNGIDFSMMFYNCKKLTSVPELDTSNAKSMHSMFADCKALTSIPQLDTSNVESFTAMFDGCRMLTTITKMDINKGKYLSYMFDSCTNLTDLYLYNIRKSIQIGSGTSYGHLLTVDSLVHTIKELCTVTTSQTLTMGSANLEKIANLYCKITDDTTEKKPMELCESTDEGAMTLTDYASEKGWVLA